MVWLVDIQGRRGLDWLLQEKMIADKKAFCLTIFYISALAALSLLPIVLVFLPGGQALAQSSGSYIRQGARVSGQRSGRVPSQPGGGMIYPEFRHGNQVVRWIKEQMPLKVYVSRGLSLDGFIDESAGVPVVNVDNVAGWPPLVANLLADPEALNKLPAAPGYSEAQWQAAIQGINEWKAFEKEGLFSFFLTEEPGEADIHVFWTNHFVNKLGLALFANDIRGLTSKEIFPVKAVLAGGQAAFKPVVILLRTSEADGTPMPFAKMKSAAAHEFGHALGIDGHSNNPQDLMSKYYGRGVISPNDSATIRYLYHVTPDLMP